MNGPSAERIHRGWFAVFACLVFFVGLAALPLLTAADTTPPWVAAAQQSSPVPLPKAPAALPAVKVLASAQPVDPNQPAATQPTLDSTHEAALVAGEDNRLRTLLHRSSRLGAPATIDVPGSLGSLVLPGRAAPYTFTDLLSAGVVVKLQNPGWYLLVDSVLVAPNASLQITAGTGGLTELLLSSTAASFSSLVTWSGTLSLAGTARQPLIVTGWDQVNNQPAQDRGYGRPYIRAVGGTLQLNQVQASSLGFWSGRTGGVAWTGISRQRATGGASSSSFVGDTYGAFVSRATQVVFKDDLFESNELDGLRLHRDADNSTVTSSAAARNGVNGFVVSREANGDVLNGDVAIHNAGNGFLLNGQPLVNGASPSGGQAQPSAGTAVIGGDAENNGRAGILVEGGSGTVIQNNIVCGSAASTAIAIRLGASNTHVVGNEARCGQRVALSIGPSVTGTTVSANVLGHARIGVLIRNSAGVRLLNNRMNTLSVFAISVRGSSPGVVGNDNVIAGAGFNPIDFRAGASPPLLLNTDLRGWTRVSSPSALAYLRYHPLLTTWLGILVLVALSWLVVRMRRRSRVPYQHALAWMPWHAAQAMVHGPTNGTAAAPVSNSHAAAASMPALSAPPRAPVAGADIPHDRPRPVPAGITVHVRAANAPPPPPSNGHALHEHERAGNGGAQPAQQQRGSGHAIPTEAQPSHGHQQQAWAPPANVSRDRDEIPPPPPPTDGLPLRLRPVPPAATTRSSEGEVEISGRSTRRAPL